VFIVAAATAKAFPATVSSPAIALKFFNTSAVASKLFFLACASESDILIFASVICLSLVKLVCLDASVKSSKAICASIFACVPAFALSTIACSLIVSCSASSKSISANLCNLNNSSSICSALNLFCSIDNKDSLSNFAFVISIASLSKEFLLVCCS